MSQKLPAAASPSARKRLQHWPHKTTPLYRKHLQKHGELRQCDAWMWQLRGDGILLNWWPHKGKWKLDGEELTTGDFKEMLREIEARASAFKAAVNFAGKP